MTRQLSLSSLTDPLAGLSPREWDDLAGEHFYSSSAWSLYNARNSTDRTGAVAARLPDNELAAVPVAEGTSTQSGLFQWSDLLAGFGLPRIPPTGLMLGPRQGYQTHLLTSAGLDPVIAARLLVPEARRLQKDVPAPDGSACVAMYLTTAGARAVAATGVASLPVLLDVDAWLKVPADGWEAWLSALPYRRRVSIRREVRLFHEAGYEVSHGPLLAYLHSLGPLALATAAKYGARNGIDHYQGLLKAHVDGMGDAAQVAVCARRGEPPVGFCLYYISNDTLYLRWAGFDYERTCAAAEYFNLVYYAHIARAPLTGVRRIHAGIKATQAKALRGASLSPLWLVDLSEDSALLGAEAAIREHNRLRAQQVLGDPSTAPGVADKDEWEIFA
jgi:uncharacterized protein